MKQANGFTLIEMLVTLGVASSISLIAVANLKSFYNPAVSGAAELASFIKQTRARALTNITTYTVRPTSSNRIITTSGTSCAPEVQVSAPQLTLRLPTGANLNDLTWSICYTTRGISQSSADIVVQDSEGSQTVQVVLGGGVRVL